MSNGSLVCYTKISPTKTVPAIMQLAALPRTV